MARKVIFKGKGPLKVENKWVCTCGLSKGWQAEEIQPFCDGSHKFCKEEDETKVFEYDSEGKATEVNV